MWVGEFFFSLLHRGKAGSSTRQQQNKHSNEMRRLHSVKMLSVTSGPIVIASSATAAPRSGEAFAATKGCPGSGAPSLLSNAQVWQHQQRNFRLPSVWSVCDSCLLMSNKFKPLQDFNRATTFKPTFGPVKKQKGGWEYWLIGRSLKWGGVIVALAWIHMCLEFSYVYWIPMCYSPKQS